MAVKRTESDWTAYVGCYWRAPYDWDRTIEVGLLHCPEGMAEVSIQYMQPKDRPRYQLLTVDTVIDGRRLHLREERTERDFVTKRGAQVIARRWLREQLEERP